EESLLFYAFLFPSRRRHTRSKRDWSSDVCSSDLRQDVQRLKLFFHEHAQMLYLIEPSYLPPVYFKKRKILYYMSLLLEYNYSRTLTYYLLNLNNVLRNELKFF